MIVASGKSGRAYAPIRSRTKREHMLERPWPKIGVDKSAMAVVRGSTGG